MISPGTWVIFALSCVAWATLSGLAATVICLICRKPAPKPTDWSEKKTISG